MANNLENSTIQKSGYLENHLLSTKQVKKIDKHLSIEFTDIKQEPIYHFDHYQDFQQVKNEIKSKCISCDTYFENPGHSDGMAAIHEACFQKICTKLYLANDKAQDLEVTNKSMIKTIEMLENTNKELCEKFILATREIQEDTNLSVTEFRLPKSVSENLDAEKLNDEKNCLNDENRKFGQNHQNIESQTCSPISNSNKYRIGNSINRSQKVATITTPLKAHYKKKRVDKKIEMSASTEKISKSTHQCSVCDKTFPYHWQKKRHEIAVHEKEKHYSCTHCSKKYGYKSDMIKHMKIVHYGEQVKKSFARENKMFKCGICFKRFEISFLLKRHTKTVHQDERPFQCNICDMNFKDKDVMVRHKKRVHEEIKPHQCDQCQYQTTIRTALLKHKIKAHVSNILT